MKIKEIRKSTGLSQSKFADKFGINVRTLQDWESGRSNPPSYLCALLQKVIQAEDGPSVKHIIYADKRGILEKHGKRVIIRDHLNRIVFDGEPGFNVNQDRWCLETFVADKVRENEAKIEKDEDIDKDFWRW